MTERRIAFLRAINVGGRRIEMDELRELFEELGYDNVQTHGASGNVIFDSEEEPSELESRLASDLEEELGYEVITFVRTMSDLSRIAGTRAFEEEAAQPRTQRYISFLREPLDAEQLSALSKLKSDVDDFEASGPEIVWFRRLDAGESIANAELEKAAGVDSTRRTLGTVKKIVAKYALPTG